MAAAPEAVTVHLQTYAGAIDDDEVAASILNPQRTVRPWMSTIEVPSGIDADVHIQTPLIHEMPTQPQAVLMLYTAIAMAAPPGTDVITIDVIARSAGAHLIMGILARYPSVPPLLRAMGAPAVIFGTIILISPGPCPIEAAVALAARDGPLIRIVHAPDDSLSPIDLELLAKAIAYLNRIALTMIISSIKGMEHIAMGSGQHGSQRAAPAAIHALRNRTTIGPTLEEYRPVPVIMADNDQYAYDVPAIALIIDAQYYARHQNHVGTWSTDHIKSMGLEDQDDELYGDTLYRIGEATNCMLTSAGDREMLAHPDSHPEYLGRYTGGEASIDVLRREIIGDMKENGITKFIRRLILRANLSTRHQPSST